jgi:hypothetical protein
MYEISLSTEAKEFHDATTLRSGIDAQVTPLPYSILSWFTDASHCAVVTCQ